MSTLEKNIENYKNDFQQRVPKESQDIINNAIEKLKISNFKENALKVGNKVPEFTLSNQKSKIINIKDIIEKNSYTIISFYRGSWSAYCNMQLIALQKIVSQLKILHSSLVVISPQTPDKLSYTSEKYGLTFEILYDKNNTIAKEFKILTKMDKELSDVYDSLKIDILEANRNGTYDLPLPATFIINKNYEIIYTFVDEDYRKRCDSKMILDAIKKDLIKKK